PGTLTFGAVSGTIAGQAIPDFQVSVLDQFGKLYKDKPVPVTISVTGPGPLSGTATVNSAAGVATFSGLVLQKAGSYTFSASAAGTPAIVSNLFTITAAAAATLAFKSTPASVGAGTLP